MTDGRHGGPEQTAESTAPVRLNKYLSDAGVCSRRQADRYAQEGRITIDGQVAELGQKVLPGQKVCVDGRPVGAEGGVSHRRIVLAVNKPRGIVCTTSRQEKDNIVDFVGYPERIYPMGRQLLLEYYSRSCNVLRTVSVDHHSVGHRRLTDEKEVCQRVGRYTENRDGFLRSDPGLCGIYLRRPDLLPCAGFRANRRAFDALVLMGGR